MRKKNSTLYDQRDNKRKIASIEGTVENVVAKRYLQGDIRGYTPYGVYSMRLKIDSLKGEIWISDGNFRVDIGERVRVYSTDGFDAPSDRVDNVDVYKAQALQILNGQGDVKFQYSSNYWLDFR